MENKIAKTLYPSDGKKVRCIFCKRIHIRRDGWGHITHPVCEKCDGDWEKELMNVLGDDGRWT
jgi:hypothetical protein